MRARRGVRVPCTTRCRDPREISELDLQCMRPMPGLSSNPDLDRLTVADPQRARAKIDVTAGRRERNHPQAMFWNLPRFRLIVAGNKPRV